MNDAETTTRPDVFIGTLICRASAYVIDAFLNNQREIQDAYPGRLIFATDEPDYVSELKMLLARFGVLGDVITFETVKPAWAKDRTWALASGREALRRYTLKNGAEYLLFLDADMTYDPAIISILRQNIRGYNAVYSGFMLRQGGGWGMGTGCAMVDRAALSRITFHGHEFRNGEIVTEDETLDMDLFATGSRANKGLFLSNRHYKSRDEYYTITPAPMPLFRKVTNSLPVRYALMKMSILCHFNFGLHLRVLIERIAGKKTGREK